MSVGREAVWVHTCNDSCDKRKKTSEWGGGMKKEEWKFFLSHPFGAQITDYDFAAIKSDL